VILPQVSLYQRDTPHDCDLAWLLQAMQKAVPLVLEHIKNDDASLLHLTEVEATIVSDAAIAQVHADFLDDPTPTDVITFHHGEIIVSADTAAREGPAHGHTLNQELCLYLIHGLMHLAGWDDHEEAEAAEMKRRQEAVLEELTAKGQGIRDKG
jgi:probable rRNA maturation factor